MFNLCLKNVYMYIRMKNKNKEMWKKKVKKTKNLKNKTDKPVEKIDKTERRVSKTNSNSS